MSAENAYRAFLGLPPIEVRPPRPHWEEIMRARSPTNGRALVVRMLQEVARERRKLAKHGWRWSPAYKAQLMTRPREILAELPEIRKMVERQAGERLP